MGTNISIKSKVDYNQISGLNFVLPEQLTTGTGAITNPVNGQITYENNTVKIYNGTKAKWEKLGQGAMTLKGTVYKPLMEEPPTGYVEDLPETPAVGDSYMVGKDGYYGETTKQTLPKQYAQVRDMFVCITEAEFEADGATIKTDAVWTLVPSGNGRYVLPFGQSTTDPTATAYTFDHGLGTSELVVKVYEQIYDNPSSVSKVLQEENEVLVSTTLLPATSSENDRVRLDFAKALSATDFYKIVIIAG